MRFIENCRVTAGGGGREAFKQWLVVLLFFLAPVSRVKDSVLRFPRAQPVFLSSMEEEQSWVH